MDHRLADIQNRNVVTGQAAGQGRRDTGPIGPGNGHEYDFAHEDSC